MLKYIIFDNNGLEYPVVFPSFTLHVDMRNMFRHKEVISAGEFRLDGSRNIIIKHGSISLRIASDINQRKKDSVVLADYLQKDF